MSTELFDVNATLGALLVGFGASCMFYGILTTQIYVYLRSYPSDRTFNKVLVASLLVLETANQCFVGHSVYFYTVTNYGSPLVLLIGDVPWTLILQTTLGSIVGSIVRGCFAVRVWRFSNSNWPITAAIALFTAGHLGVSILFTQRCFVVKKLVYLNDMKSIATISLALGAFTDVFIAAALCHFLRNYRTGQKQSDSLVNNLILYAINSGLVTSAFSIATLILYNTMPQNFVFMATFFVLSKLFAISLMANLNTRKTIRGRGTYRDTERGTDRRTETFKSNIVSPLQNSFYMTPPLPSSTIQTLDTQVDVKVKGLPF